MGRGVRGGDERAQRDVGSAIGPKREVGSRTKGLHLLNARPWAVGFLVAPADAGARINCAPLNADLKHMPRGGRI